MPSLGPVELGIILVIVLLIFGAGRIGDLGGSLGRGIREFKTAVKDEEGGDPDDIKTDVKTEKVVVVEKRPTDTTATAQTTTTATTTEPTRES